MDKKMEKCLNSLRQKIICRDNLIKCLFSLIGLSDEEMVQSIFVHGHTASGKSLVIESLLTYLEYNVCIINCVECYSSKLIYEHILNDLSLHEMNSKNNFTVYQKCDNMMDFIIYLQIAVQSDPRPIVIVFDKCDRLRDMDMNLLPALVRLRELTGLNLCTIFVSDIVWEKYYPKNGLLDPIKIHFPQYTREDMLKVLFLYKPIDFEDGFYVNYLNLFLSVFFRCCRDCNELRYMAKINFDKYVEPIESGKIEKNDVRSLWRNISGILKSNLEVVYLRVSADDSEQRTKLCQEIESTTKLALSFELPFYAKYMLIAAYLASYNPAKDDKRLFVKRSSKKKKRNTVTKNPVKLNTQLGPKAFTLDRMLAIFYAILNEKVGLTANLLAQIPTMCQLRLLSIVGDNNLDGPKYKCCVSYDFIVIISKTVGFNVRNYLHDFI
ncbi:origin recognition complex subunit 5 [Diprion similis]|uniref:origin recognition complex subunit 5 n=1 Tax=Diprion similis TaxID=362088 RepID=UPI001EF87295|nr:origin recognition complex subunit 5 [Diprion similis]